MRLIETDSFPFEFLSRIAERESWRKEIHRPIYHVHKWWAKRLGSIFRGILLGATLEDASLERAFYQKHQLKGIAVFDPFMGSGTTVGEAHKLGMTALGRDINPVATESAEVSFGRLDRGELQKALVQILDSVGESIRSLYRSSDSQGRPCDVLYHFWVMQTDCPACRTGTDLFSSYVVASNAYPQRKPEVHLFCPSCGEIFHALDRYSNATCPACAYSFNPNTAPAKGAKAVCRSCNNNFVIVNALAGQRPRFRLYGKLVLNVDGQKEYLRATEHDLLAYAHCSQLLQQELERNAIRLPTLRLEHGYNTRQAIGYGFKCWRDFFNDRQLLALGWLREAIEEIQNEPARKAMRVLFSGLLEFNNLFTSYKGEGTGAVRHMFSHHILKPERIPIEANVWGTSKSSGSFTGLFRTRLLRALEYQQAPTEVGADQGSVSAEPFNGRVEVSWPTKGDFVSRGIYVSCGDSARSDLATGSIDLVVTDPPFFDNVHYSELADFFYSWQTIDRAVDKSTRHAAEVQDVNADQFAAKLRLVFAECARVLKEDGLLIFTYHHSRPEGWSALAQAILGAGFYVVNSHPVKAEMSVATPKTQAKEPIQIDIVLVCRKRAAPTPAVADTTALIAKANAKAVRMSQAGFSLSANDRKVIAYGQLLCGLRDADAICEIEALASKSGDTDAPEALEAA